MSAAATQVLLAKKWEEKVDPTGWWMSEKLDGVRAYWSGSAFYSRNGNQFMAPDFFTADLPKKPLDGELWCGRGLFHKTMSIIKKKTPNKEQQADWKYVTYLVFDAPAVKDPYEKRVKWLQHHIDASKPTTYAAVVGVSKCEGVAQLKKILKQVLIKGGEGLMLRQPGSKYEHCRSSTLLKVKFFHDEEAKVTGHLPGSGRCANMMGKLTCVLPNGVTFKVGTGFTDAQRKNPPKVGSVITFKYQELSVHGNPRFPAFVRARPEMSWEEVTKNAKKNTPFSQIKKPEPKLKRQHSILFSTVPSRDTKGSKMITSDDEGENVASDSETESSNSSSKKKKGKRSRPSKDSDDENQNKPLKKCIYGALCFRTCPSHLASYSHPKKTVDEDDEDSKTQHKKKKQKGESDEEESKKVPCKFGSKCYRSSEHHLKQFSHPPKNSEAEDEEEDEEDGDAAKSQWGITGHESTDDDEESVTISKKDWEQLQSTLKKFSGLVASKKKAKPSSSSSDAANGDTAPPLTRSKSKELDKANGSSK